ncbi:cupin domain-containing protein [Lentzea sp. NPDC004782]|uniref:cupin domain-containing protein n=1 Tax=Lentzea sp. NPDC004782 TaxID=3154458 RepID=UPI0033BF2E5C
MTDSTLIPRLNWQKRTMPVTRRVIGDLAKRSSPGRRFAYWGHITANSVPLFEWLSKTGVDLRLGVCDPNTSPPEVLEHLSSFTFLDGLRDAVEWRPELVFDTGGELVTSLVAAGVPPLAAVESTTSGITALEQLSVAFPVLQWADIPLKQDVEHRHHVAAGVLGAIAWLTGMSVEGKRFLVVGYGKVGEGIADRARKLGALVTVAEPHPLRALNAHLAGHAVVPTPQAAAHAADYVVTATGRAGVLNADVLDRLPDGAIVANAGHSPAEIDFGHLNASVAGEPMPGIVEFRPAGKSLYVLAGGSPVNLAADRTYGDDLWDLFSAVTVLSCDWLITEGWRTAKPGVQPLPLELQSYVAGVATAPPLSSASHTAIKPASSPDGHALQELVGPQLGNSTSHTVACSTLAPGGAVEEHFHLRTEETYVVLAGSITVLLDGVPKTLRTGDVVAIPPGVHHGVTAGDEGARFIAISVPPWQPTDHHVSPSR